MSRPSGLDEPYRKNQHGRKSCATRATCPHYTHEDGAPVLCRCAGGLARRRRRVAGRDVDAQNPRSRLGLEAGLGDVAVAAIVEAQCTGGLNPVAEAAAEPWGLDGNASPLTSRFRLRRRPNTAPYPWNGVARHGGTNGRHRLVRVVRSGSLRRGVRHAGLRRGPIRTGASTAARTRSAMSPLMFHGAPSSGNIASASVLSLGCRTSAPHESRMERLWSRAVATSGNRSQMERPRKRLNQPKTVAVGCDRSPRECHGKEGSTSERTASRRARRQGPRARNGPPSG